MYDDLLKIQLPPGAEMVAFADDARLIITGKDLEKIRRIFGLLRRSAAAVDEVGWARTG